MLGQMLRRIHTAMLTACAAEREHQRRESTLNVAAHMVVGQLIHRIQKRQYLAIVLQESNHRLIQSRQLLIRLISTRVVRASTVEHVTTTIATLVLGDALAIRKTEHLHHQRPLRIVFREGGRTILRMSLIGVQIGRLITIRTTCHCLNLLELWQFGEFLQYRYQIRIVELSG